MNQFLMIEGKKQKVLNIMDGDIFLPVRETEKHFKGMNFRLPYERGIKQQMITGTLTERLGSCKYRTEMERLAKAVI